MWTITNRLRKLRNDKRGISNVIVIVLSLVILVIVASNVILWSYQMNQLDWEKMQEKLGIVDVARISNSSWFVTQSEYTLNIGSRTNGVYADTQTIGDQYESFLEGLNWWNAGYTYRRQMTIVNNAASTLNLGYSICVAIDTASLVSAGKMLASGNDLRVIYWSGSSWIELDREAIDSNSASTQVWFRTQATIVASGSDNNYYIYYGNPSAGSPPADKNRVYLWFDDFNRADKPDITTEASYNVKTGVGAWSIDAGRLKNVGADEDPNKLIIAGLGNVNTDIDMLVKINVASFVSGDQSRMGLSCCMNTDPSRGSGYCALFHQDTNSVDLLNDLRSWGTGGSYSWSLDTWYYMRFRVVSPASKLGKVKVWQVGAAEPSTWTVDGNFGSGTARSYGEVGFGGSRTTDTTYFDDILIRYISYLEPSAFLGTEESQSNNRLDIDGTFVIDTPSFPLNYTKSVEIQIRYKASDTGEKWYLKAYNWSSLTYSDSGFNSTAGHVSTAYFDYYTINITDKWKSYVGADGTMKIKFRDEGADGNQTVIDIDFLAVRVLVEGTQFNFESKGAVTCHIVSIWVVNATTHTRYELDVYVNGGELLSYIRTDISLPNGSYFMKATTERGNTAVYSST